MGAVRGLMSVKEAAEALGVSQRRAYQLVEAGRLSSVRLGGHILVRASSVERFERLPPGRPRKKPNRKRGRRKR